MWNYPESTPIRVKGGIKSQTKQGKFAQSWCAKRWIEALETFYDSARLKRGRSYAREGQVMKMEINKGEIEAIVQGSQSTPYRVTIKMEPLPQEVWKKINEKFSGQKSWMTKFAMGVIPYDFEKTLKEMKISLFPTTHTELLTECSCPDTSNPCKHVAAVYYLLGEEFDRDPFLILKMRGIQ